jgi:hypothetical protein
MHCSNCGSDNPENDRFCGDCGAALEQEGAVPEALETMEQALQLNPDEMQDRSEIFRIHRELWLKQRKEEEAATNFHEAIALEQSMGAKA